MTNNKPSPVGLAIVVCDQIIEDKATNKKSLVGIFNQIASSQFPCRHPQVSVFVCLTEGRGQCEAKLRIVHEDDSKPVGEITGKIQFPDIHSVVELAFNLVGIVFPEPGLYSIEFYCDDALVLERRFNVIHSEPPKGPPPEEM